MIDDEPMVLAVMHRVLSGRHEVTTAETAEHALMLLRGGHRFELVMCDLMMPQMSGADFYEELERTLPEITKRVVFLSGGALTSRARQLLERIPNHRLEKPFELQEIRALVQRLTT